MISQLFDRAGIALSVLAHAGLVGAVLLLAEVRPFADVPEQRIEVDVVTADEAPPPAPEPQQEDKKPEQPSLNFDVASTPTEDSKAQQPAAEPASAQTTPAAPPKPEAPKPAPKSEKSDLKPDPVPPKQPKPAQQPAEAPASPAAPANQPSSQAASAPQSTSQPAAFGATPVFMPPTDANLKYAVGLGLPADGGDFDAPAETVANIDPESAAALRQRLKSCAALPKGLSASDNVKIVLRVALSPDGRLMHEPALIEASASAKGPVLMKGAINALTSCQPYAMLPADKYQEWKVLDLSFTPQDFRGG
jgi:outer membrane biosynthesis protein TonB